MTLSQIPKLNVVFLGCSKDPIEILYSAYRISQSQEDILDIWQQIQEKTISRDEMAAYLPERLGNEYPSSMRQAQFVFMVDHISRISAQLLNCQSTEPEKANLICADLQIQHNWQLAVTPPSFQQNQELMNRWFDLQSEITSFYKRCLEMGIGPDDAGFALPQGLLCREQISMSFQAMQQFLDVSMCEQSLWEIKEMSWQIYQVMKKEFPTLAKRLGIKCWENRNLFCDESIDCYETCKWNKTRPHKTHLNSILVDESQTVSEKTVM